MVRPQKHIDRGPLDDVVEQVRGQPELEEEEMDSSAHLYKPPKEISGLYFDFNYVAFARAGNHLLASLLHTLSFGMLY